MEAPPVRGSQSGGDAPIPVGSSLSYDDSAKTLAISFAGDL
jgi:hypothetical protein